LSDRSKIEWTEATWNPVRGCSKVSEGCKNCYAERFAERWRGLKGHPYELGFDVRTVPEMLDQPARWRAPRLVFVNSMSDLFHEKVPTTFIEQVFEVMAATPRHTFQVLTKRAERLAKLAPKLNWASNIWQGVSIESQEYVGRVDLLRRVPARVRFLSVEPMLGQVKLNLSGAHWVIAGGESGPGARTLDAAWVRLLRDQCLRARVPFFFKQWGGVRKHLTGRVLDGRTWNDRPGG
jgi:protein gp37